MLTNITITVSAVSHEIDPSNPEVPLVVETQADPRVFEGKSLTDLVEHWLLPRSGQRDASHVFTAQEIMNQLMQRPDAETEDGFFRKLDQAARKFPGNTPRERATEAYTEGRLMHLLKKAEEE